MAGKGCQSYCQLQFGIDLSPLLTWLSREANANYHITCAEYAALKFRKESPINYVWDEKDELSGVAFVVQIMLANCSLTA